MKIEKIHHVRFIVINRDEKKKLCQLRRLPLLLLSLLISLPVTFKEHDASNSRDAYVGVARSVLLYVGEFLTNANSLRK